MVCRGPVLALALAVAWSGPADAIELARPMGMYPVRTGPPLAMLDIEQVGHVVDALRQAADRTAHPDPTKAAALGLALLRERQQVERDFRRLETPHWDTLNASGGLVEGGLSEVVALIRRLRSS